MAKKELEEPDIFDKVGSFVVSIWNTTTTKIKEGNQDK